jgi:hypothetical protein
MHPPGLEVLPAKGSGATFEAVQPIELQDHYITQICVMTSAIDS